jgi:hypothetical protein
MLLYVPVKEIFMPSAKLQYVVKPGSRHGRVHGLLKVAALVAAGLVSANASAGLLEKLLAPAIGVKAGFSEGKKTYDEDTLKPDELMNCIIKAHDIDSRTGQTPEESAALQKERAALNEEGKALIAKIEKTKDEPLDDNGAARLNAEKEAYVEKQKAFNARAGDVNSQAQARDKAMRADINNFIDTCSGRRFFNSDLAAVRPKLPFDISDILAGKK